MNLVTYLAIDMKTLVVPDLATPNRKKYGKQRSRQFSPGVQTKKYYMCSQPLCRFMVTDIL